MLRSGKASAAEKSNFAQTCNRLSQYLKQRGRPENTRPGITSMPETAGPEASRQPATTLNLLPGMETSAETSSILQNSGNMEPMKLFPQHVGFASSDPVKDYANKPAYLRKSSPAEDPASSQMTIFYNGQVIVFDNFPAEKAEEILALARKGMSNTPAKEKADKSTTAPFNKLQGKRPRADDSDLPIARKASLHRFLEKRKDRVAAKAPSKEVELKL